LAVEGGLNVALRILSSSLDRRCSACTGWAVVRWNIGALVWATEGDAAPRAALGAAPGQLVAYLRRRHAKPSVSKSF